MSEMEGIQPIPDIVKDGQRRLATVTAVFWFEIVGTLALGAMVVASPPLVLRRSRTRL